MAHEIQSSDNFAEVRSNGKRAWHGLGKEIAEGLSAEEAFKLCGLGWETELAPIRAEINGQIIELSEHRAHIRLDTMSSLGIVSDGYRSFENVDLARFADALAGADKAITTETCGSLYSGRRVFALVRLPRDIVLPGDDVLHQYVLVSNGHGGFASFSCYPTSVRVVCANTLRWSERDVARGIKFRHSGNLEEKVAQARLALGIALEETSKFEAQVKKLVSVKIYDEDARSWMLTTWEQIFGKINMRGEDEVVRKLLEKRDDLVDLWMANLSDDRQQTKAAKGTMWGAYNAVSQWQDHERGRFKDTDESDARVHSNLFGISQKQKLITFRSALTV